MRNKNMIEVGAILKVRYRSWAWFEKTERQWGLRVLEVGDRWRVIRVVVEGRKKVFDIQSLSDPSVIARGFSLNDDRFTNLNYSLSQLKRFKTVKRKLKKMRRIYA